MVLSYQKNDTLITLQYVAFGKKLYEVSCGFLCPKILDRLKKVIWNIFKIFYNKLVLISWFCVLCNCCKHVYSEMLCWYCIVVSQVFVVVIIGLFYLRSWNFSVKKLCILRILENRYWLKGITYCISLESQKKADFMYTTIRQICAIMIFTLLFVALRR